MGSETFQTPSKEQLAEELKELATEAEELLHDSGEDLVQHFAEFQEKLTGALALAEEAYESMEETASNVVSRADETIRKNPYPALGIALGVGLVAGFIIKRNNL